MEVSDQLQASTSVIHIIEGPRADLEVLKRNESLVQPRIQTRGCPTYSLITIPTELSRFTMS